MGPQEIEQLIARDARRVLDNPERPPTADLSVGLRALLVRHLPSPAFEGVLQPTLRIRTDHLLEVRGLMAMKQFMAAVEFGAWDVAADEMLHSEWGEQDKQRARTLAGLMLTGA